jgi:hypothetical protein
VSENIYQLNQGRTLVPPRWCFPEIVIGKPMGSSKKRSLWEAPKEKPRRNGAALHRPSGKGPTAASPVSRAMIAAHGNRQLLRTRTIAEAQSQGYTHLLVTCAGCGRITDIPLRMLFGRSRVTSESFIGTSRCAAKSVETRRLQLTCGTAKRPFPENNCVSRAPLLRPCVSP